jgi:hypothetical protein
MKFFPSREKESVLNENKLTNGDHRKEGHALVETCVVVSLGAGVGSLVDRAEV